MTLGPALEPAAFRIPANVLVCEAAPHSRLFPHASAMVTHAGHGTIIRALAYGVPLVCMPIGRDQPENAARAVFHKAGLRLAPTAPVTAIRDAIQRVVREPSFRDAARAARTAHSCRCRSWGGGTRTRIIGIVHVA